MKIGGKIAKLASNGSTARMKHVWAHFKSLINDLFTVMSMGTTKIVSLRMDVEDAESLEKLAREDGLSMNASIAQILKSHLEWERIAPKVGLIPIQKRIFNDLLKALPEDSLRNLAIKEADAAMDDLTMFTGKDDLESFLLVTKLRVKKSGFLFSETQDKEGNVTITSHHGMGRRWSEFFTAYNQRIVENLGYPVRVVIRENLWITRIMARS